MEKKSLWSSSNFLTSLISLALLFITYQQIPVNISAEETFSQLQGKNFITAILTVIIPNFFNPLMKLIGKITSGGFDWGFIKSPNFWTQILTVVLASVTAITGIEFGGDAPGQLVASWGDGALAFVMAMLINIINPLWHFFFDKKVAVDPQSTLDKKIKINNA